MLSDLDSRLNSPTITCKYQALLSEKMVLVQMDTPQPEPNMAGRRKKEGLG